METQVMNPRLKSSKKWTAFPKEYSDQIRGVFSENFAKFLSDATLIVEGRIYAEEIVLRVGLLENGRLAQANFEVSMNYSQEEKDAIQRIHNCVDAAAGMMLEFLEKDGEVDFPYVWKEFPFQGRKLYLQFTTENSSLESQANKLLGLAEGDLVQEEDSESEDALARAELSEELSPPRDNDEELDEEIEEDPSEISGPQTAVKNRKKKKDDLH